MDRQRLVEMVATHLGERQLVWAGIRGEDAEPLADLPQLAASFSIIGSYRRRSTVEGLAYEDMSGRRTDLEVWDIDDHLDAAATHEFRHALLAALGRPSALLPYRPSRFLSSVAFARRDRCLDLGVFAGLQQAFEYKPWVETSVAEAGVPTVSWQYVADEEQHLVQAMVQAGPVILRRSRTSGGEGIVRVDDPDTVAELWPRGPDTITSVSPYLADTLPLNIAGTVWDEGVTVHLPSVQLIGIPSCVARPFGYCGNDYGAATDLPDRILDGIERSVRTIGAWMGRHGYRGTFGVDFLVHRGEPLYVETNARFQGSSHLASQRASEAGESCEYIDHIAARSGLPVRPQAPLRERARVGGDLAHVVIHRVAPGSAPVDVEPLVAALHDVDREGRADVLAPRDLAVDHGAAVARFTVRQRLTDTGFALRAPWEAIVTMWQSRQPRI